MLLLDAGPRVIEVGVGFNQQQNGESAIWVVSANIPSSSELYWDNIKLDAVLSLTSDIL